MLVVLALHQAFIESTVSLITTPGPATLALLLSAALLKASSSWQSCSSSYLKQVSNGKLESSTKTLVFYRPGAACRSLHTTYPRSQEAVDCGMVLVLIGTIILATTGSSGGKATIGALFLCGVGFATPLTLLFAVAQLATSHHLLGLATGQLIAARAISQAVGASALGAAFQAKVATILPAKVSTTALKAGLPITSLPELVRGIATGNKTLIMSAPGDTMETIGAASNAATDAYVKSFHYGWDTALPFVAVALLIAFALDRRR